MKLRNIIIAALIAVIALSYSSPSKAADVVLISNGRIVYDNETPDDPSDDIILFDAEDFKTLKNKIDALESSL